MCKTNKSKFFAAWTKGIIFGTRLLSPSPYGLDFGTLDFGLGLDNFGT